MTPTPRTALGFSIALILVALAASRADEPKSAPRDPFAHPPPCSARARPRAKAAPARSMPEMFDRMAANPATAWQGMVEELSIMEGPALEGVTLSAEEERRIGRQARDEYLRRAEAKGHPIARNPRKEAYLRALVDRFAARMTHRDRYPRIDISIIDAPVADGQSFPGGFLVFSTALLDEPDEATVAGVVAHELAHLDRGHLFSYARRSKLAEATYSRPPNPADGADFGRFFTRQMALFGLLMNPYRPEHEHEADCTSVTWLYQEGYDPRGLVGFFERMFARNRDRPGDPAFQFGRSHPFSLDRREHVLARFRQLQRWKRRDDLGLFADNLLRLVPRDRAAPGGAGN